MPDEAEDEGGLPPVKDENEVWRESGRKEGNGFISESYEAKTHGPVFQE